MHNKAPRITITHQKRLTGLLILTVVLGSLLFSACPSPPARSSETEFVLGTTITVTTYGNVPEDVVDAVFARVREIEEKMSISREDYTMTELIAVNDAAGIGPVEVSEDTFEVVREAIEYSRISGGAFDVSVAPLVDLWGIGSGSAAIPADAAIDDALRAVDYRNVELDPIAKTIYLTDPDMGIDVGGIAKGYAADEAARILREAGVRHALLDFGGNILTVGRKPDGTRWRIGIQVPDSSRGDYVGIAEVEDKSVVTSGTYERYFIEDGVRYHHILDTETGYPVRNGLESVTIVTESSIRADALSTAIFAMGAERGHEFVESHPDIEALFIQSDQTLIFSSGMDEFFEITSSEFTRAQR
ncbi:MAG: FAD:protein FMN transferase [Spirochaetota bacterium]